MDAEKVIKELGRMCCSMENCADCKVSKLRDEEPHFCMHYVYKYPAETVRIVEEWSKAHPIQTRREKFKEVFGKPPTAKVNCFMGCIEGVEADWWDAPYEAPKGAE